MEKVTIDGKEYEHDSLSEEARAQMTALQITDQRIAQTKQELAILQTARNAYAVALQNILSDEEVLQIEVD